MLNLGPFPEEAFPLGLQVNDMPPIELYYDQINDLDVTRVRKSADQETLRVDRRVRDAGSDPQGCRAGS